MSFQIKEFVGYDLERELYKKFPRKKKKFTGKKKTITKPIEPTNDAKKR